MKQLIETTFPCKTGNCIETRNETIFWVDEYPSNVFPKEIRGKSFTLFKTDDDKLFMVNNPYHKEITFVAIDAGIFTDRSSKCDFALFDNQRFCFVECKDSVKKQRSKERKGAFIQLKATIL